MERWFKVTGPCSPQEHYALSPERRFNAAAKLIDVGRWFVLRAPRHSGKTTGARWIAKQLNDGTARRALWIDLTRDPISPDVEPGMRAMIGAILGATRWQLPSLSRPATSRMEEILQDPESALCACVNELCTASPQPLVWVFDHTDSLTGATRRSFLTQLRRMFLERAQIGAPHSLVLLAERPLMDDKATGGGPELPFGGAAHGASLEPFTFAEVAELLAQHTTVTGQMFEPSAVERLYEHTHGHPRHVNVIADRIVRFDARDRSVAITPRHVDSAKETLMEQPHAYYPLLATELREPRVSRVLDPMLSSEGMPGDVLDDDVAYVVGLGLIRLVDKQWQMANPIYREVIPRALTHLKQTSIYMKPHAFERADGSLDMPALMTAWQKFWRIDGHLAAEGFTYRESGPHLMLMAFLQRVVNGGGRIEREYGLGRRALDLLVEWRGERHVIETKLRRDTETEEDALEQVTEYLDGLGVSEGWLVMFDLRSKQPWTERLWRRTVEVGARRVHMVGC